MVVTQLVGQGLVQPQDAAQVGAEVAARQAQAAQGSSAIALKSITGDVAASFDPLAYMAPGMALMFLMFTAANGGRTLLSERAQGTLPRLLVSPTSTAQVLGGKVLGIYLTGVAQMLILIVASTLLFGLQVGRSAGRGGAGAGGRRRRRRLGHADHRPGQDPRPGHRHRLGDHADLWHPGRLVHQHRQYAGLVRGR